MYNIRTIYLIAVRHTSKLTSFILLVVINTKSSYRDLKGSVTNANTNDPHLSPPPLIRPLKLMYYRFFLFT